MNKFDYGDRVKVVSECQTTGKIGTVYGFYDVGTGYYSKVTNVKVELDCGLKRTYNQ